MVHSLAVGALFVLFYVEPAHAYLDAGSVSMALQAITATVAAGMAGAALFWGRLKTFVFGRHDAPASAATDEESLPKK